MNFVVPSPALKEVEKILTDTDELAGFTLGPKHILFEIGGATVVCRLLEGEFLDWRKVVPTDCPLKLTANRGGPEFLHFPCGPDRLRKVQKPRALRVLGPDPLDENQHHHRRRRGPVRHRRRRQGTGDRLQCPLSFRCPPAVPSEEVVLELTNGLSPIVLTPADNKYDFAYMVLPVRIKNG